ncbi:ABC transporter ATP-binding protein [Streptomyces sp. RKND-216]|uniref:ABC transporter ATP-binding protein n=1 Tax=Streptomyces sp. RKND-216 TaxID=2562581 RepID=UPI00109E1771|nr:ATP-binding cassette domain-containing protein [Streptomyces sp. RKND-216]THA23942.1 ABC transporter ATP-binding protein [Streptomyces sp. RKND-216]
MTLQAPVVSARGLTARVGETLLLDAVDFDLHPRRVTALVGPSGSGKTTAALALLGEAGPGVSLTGRVTAGSVTVVDGDGVTREAAGIPGRVVAYMPQHPGSALNPARRTGTVLAELARLHHGPGTGAVTKALQAAQLPAGRDTRRRFPHQFSGGQRQRVALAQTLVCRPQALVLDEPSTGLDTVTRMRLAEELAGLAGAGLAVLLLSHDHDLVRALADHVVVLHRGRVTAAGEPEEALPPRRPVSAERHTPHDAFARPPVLEVRDLTAHLHGRGRGRVLDCIGLELPAGACLGVAGVSGSGKTTLARCIAGLHERHRGEVLLDGTPLPVLRRRSGEQKRRVQYVWQEVRTSFDERRPVAEQVARTAVRLREVAPDRARAEARDLLTRLGIAPDTVERRPGGLSGGELQRAALARAVLARPDVLVCDEITTALDPDATRAVVDELARLRGEYGTALLWVSHDLELLSAVAHHIVVLDGGRIVEDGTPEEVLHTPRTRQARELVGASDLSRTRLDPAVVAPAPGA